jgi:cytochrome b
MTRVTIWDRPVRLGHWLLALLVLGSWLTRHSGHWVHEALGYGVLLVVISRIYWGWRGSHYARFAQFVRSPVVTLDYARQVVAGDEKRYLGHNPLGAWMIVALLTTGASNGSATHTNV